MNHELLLPGHLYTVFVKEKLEVTTKGVEWMIDRQTGRQAEVVGWAGLGSTGKRVCVCVCVCHPACQK